MTDGMDGAVGWVGGLVGGRYRIEGQLGSGATARVYRAVDTRLGRTVAVKIFRAGTDGPAARRLADEARLLASLRHPGLVAVYDAGSDDGMPYVVMTLVEGETLRQRLVRGPVGADRCAALGAVLAGVLGHVHANGIVHRDVKPSNVLLDLAGSPLLTDFGISRLLDSTHVTTTGIVVGTVAYMAPEQVRGEPVGPPTDVYALGLVLLECLTGHVEYPGTLLEAAVARLARAPRLPADLPAPLREVLAAMTADDPRRRPTAERCRKLLVDASAADDPTVRRRVGVRPASISPGSTPSTADIRSVPRRGLVGGLAAAAVAAVVGAGLAVGGDPAPATADRPAAGPTAAQSESESSASRSAGRVGGTDARGGGQPPTDAEGAAVPSRSPDGQPLLGPPIGRTAATPSRPGGPAARPAAVYSAPSATKKSKRPGRGKPAGPGGTRGAIPAPSSTRGGGNGDGGNGADDDGNGGGSNGGGGGNDG